MGLVRRILLALPGLAVAAAVAAPVSGQTPQASPRLAGQIDDAVRAVLPAIPLRPGARDLGPIPDSESAGRLLLLLARSPRQQAELDDFLESAHTPGSPDFHHWLTPAEFGRRFGPADSDLAALRAWLESHGLTVTRLAAGRAAIEFTGTSSQLRAAFHVSLHRYAAAGSTQIAAATAPTIPAALAPMVSGLAGLGGVRPRPQFTVLGPVRMHPRTHAATPSWTYPNGGQTTYLVTPGDLAIQYDLNPVYKAGLTGSGQTIAVVAASNIDVEQVQAYRALFGLPANLPQVVVDGTDPGLTADAPEAYLDLELAGSVAPSARLVLYTSGGSALLDPLSMAALRAVEDDLAGVLSVSYGACEAYLGLSGNAFWNALWQQAAAQGQSVFVAAGDAGPAACDNFDAQQQAYSGLAVNGLASTPYNIAVGGTDFYYSSAAGSSRQVASQLAAYWTSATASAAVSLKQPVPEQPWNQFFGLNLTDGADPINQAAPSILAGGGGASGKAISGASGKTGYPKPAWQSGTGVPADGFRDLPDVSLFASTGANLSFYPICAAPGDCSSANLNPSGAVQVTGVGGTSAAAPAMAAIQALVNQKAGSWSGQAAAVYYKLAVTHPEVFHSIAVGTIQIPCAAGTANCAYDTSTAITGGYWVLPGYTAAAGYDQATGLGSVDAAKLVNDWGTVSLARTSTTLAVTPTALVHGSTVLVQGSVSGAGTPTGTVALTSNSGLAYYSGNGAMPLSGGRFYAEFDNLPGGTYQLTARYSGDAANAPSRSAPITVTVTPESSTLSTAAWAWNPWDMNLYALATGAQVPYGAQVFLDAQPLSGNAALSNQLTAATGAVQFTDKLGSATQRSSQPLNSFGLAEWSTGVFAPGAHSVTASYAGDASYKPSAATAASFTVLRGAATLTVTPLVTRVAAGATVALDLQLRTGSMPLWGQPPTGKVTATLGGVTLPVALSPFGSAGSMTMEGVAVFPNVPAGLLPISATYSGDANWFPATASGGNLLAVSTRLSPAVVLTASSAAPAPGKSVTLTATVTGPAGQPAPTGTVLFLADAGALATQVNLTGRLATLTLPAASLPNGSSVFTAVYQGDSNYTQAASGPATVRVSQPDFSAVPLIPALLLAPGASGQTSLALTAINGFSGPVSLACAPPAGITVKASNTQLTLTSAAQVQLTFTAASSAAGVYPVTLAATGGGHVHTAQFLITVHK